MSQLGRWSRILALRCDDATEIVSQEMDEPLDFVDRLALRSHILTCRSCRRFRRQLRWIRLALGALDRAWDASTNQATLTPDARDRIARALRERGNGNGDRRDS